MTDMKNMINKELLDFTNFMKDEGYYFYSSSVESLDMDSAMITNAILEKMITKYLDKYL